MSQVLKIRGRPINNPILAIWLVIRLLNYSFEYNETSLTFVCVLYRGLLSVFIFSVSILCVKLDLNPPKFRFNGVSIYPFLLKSTLTRYPLSGLESDWTLWNFVFWPLQSPRPHPSNLRRTHTINGNWFPFIWRSIEVISSIKMSSIQMLLEVTLIWV